MYEAPITRLYYTSHAREDMDLAECRRLVAQAQARNAQYDITGVLLYDSRYFLQVIEGELEPVTTLYQHIARDPRHSKVKRLCLLSVKSRHYQRWSMGLLTPKPAFIEGIMELGAQEMDEQIWQLSQQLPALHSQLSE
jgi:Sensors of blue-light using FAD